MRQFLLKHIAYLLLLTLNVSFLNTAYSQTLAGCSQATVSCLDTTPCKTISGQNVCLAGINAGAGGFNISGTCWNYQKTFPCLQKNSDCLSLQSTPGCIEIKGSPTCANDANGLAMIDPKFGCMDNIHTYSCVTQPASSTTKQVNCDASVTMGGLTWSQTSPAATDQFVASVTGRQMQYEIGRAVGNGITSLFAGDADKCTIKLGGIKNCCQGSGSGGGSNNQIASNLKLTGAFYALKSGAVYAANLGSPYVYDALQSAGLENTAIGWGKDLAIQDAGTSNAVGGLSAGGVGAFGIGTTPSAAEGIGGLSSTVSSSTIGITSSGTTFNAAASTAFSNATFANEAAQNALGSASEASASANAAVDNAIASGADEATVTALQDGAANAATELEFAQQAATDTELALQSASEAAGGIIAEEGVLFFNPYVLAASVVLMVVMSYLSCDQSDAQTMASVSKNLCHYVGSYCSLKIPLIGTCIETKQSYCCFAGIFDKELQEGVRAQEGIGWGSPESPNCSGLTIDQIMASDLSSIDFSQFAGAVQSNMSNFTADQQSVMQSTVKDTSVKIAPKP